MINYCDYILQMLLAVSFLFFGACGVSSNPVQTQSYIKVKSKFIALLLQITYQRAFPSCNGYEIVDSR